MTAKRFERFKQWVLEKKATFFLSVSAILVSSIIIFWAIYPNQSPTWTGFGEYQLQNGDIERSRTLWDWMNLLIVPLALAIGIYILNKAEKDNEQKIAKERLLESTLQDYLDRMTDLLLKENLRNSKKNTSNEAQSIARSRTLTALRTLDAVRKGILLKFLYESGLISDESVLRLKNADLSQVDLEKANLESANIRKSILVNANLNSARLVGADLSYCTANKASFVRSSLLLANLTSSILDECDFFRATLAEANLDSASLKKSNLTSIHGAKANFRSAQLQQATLNNANLTGANLIRSNLSKAHLRNANLTGANLRGANLQNADLSGAILDDADLSFTNLINAKIKPSQLSKVKSLCLATLMDGKLIIGDKDGNYTHGS